MRNIPCCIAGLAHDTNLIMVHHLQQIPFFYDLDASALTMIEQAAQTCLIDRHAFFFHQDDPATHFYLLLEGSVRLMQVTATGEQVILRFVGPQDGIGIIAALEQATYPLAAQAVHDCVALVWDHATLRQLIECYPVLALRALRLVAGHLVELQTQYRELATERVERRVARALVRLGQQVGRKVEGGILINMPLSRQDVAEMTGTNLYHVSRIVSKWEKQGLLESRRERLLIREPHRLVVIAEDMPPEIPAPLR